MKKVCTVLAGLAILVVGFGFYRGWFALSSPSPTAGSNQVNVNLATDTDKIKRDGEAVKNKAAELTGTVTESLGVPADRPREDVELNDAKPKGVEPNEAQPNKGLDSDGERDS